MTLRWQKLLWLLTALLTGCTPPIRPMTTPMQTLHYPWQNGQRAERLIVMLPGLYDQASDFEQYGFIDTLRKQGISADVIAVDAHFAYYEARDIDQRLRQEVILPARQRGYREIWLIGISLGGFGSLLYAHQWPQEITGAVLIAPYPGDPKLLAQIRKSTSPQTWANNAQPGTDPSFNSQISLWRWLIQNAPHSHAPQLYFASGREDRFSKDHTLLTPHIAPAQQLTQKGGHDWSTWQALWQEIAPKVWGEKKHLGTTPPRP